MRKVKMKREYFVTYFLFFGGKFANILKTFILKINYYDIIPKDSSFSFKNIVLKKKNLKSL
jgi:hypothetical protein